MAGISDLLVIGMILVTGYFLVSNPDIIQNLIPGNGSTTTISQEGGDGEAYAETGDGETDIDISGPGAGACANGRCEGDPAAIRRAQEMLEMIQD